MEDFERNNRILGRYDSLITDIKGINFAIFTADCLPIIIYDRINNILGMVHAGWKGTVKGISAKAIKKMSEKFDSNPEDCLVAIGPSIGPCCYEVDEKVIEPLGINFDCYQRWISSKENGRMNFDLWKANEEQLMDCGIIRDNIHNLKMCTSCYCDVFYSYRVHGKSAGRMVTIARLT